MQFTKIPPPKPLAPRLKPANHTTKLRAQRKPLLTTNQQQHHTLLSLTRDPVEQYHYHPLPNPTKPLYSHPTSLYPLISNTHLSATKALKTSIVPPLLQPTTNVQTPKPYHNQPSKLPKNPPTPPPNPPQPTNRHRPPPPDEQTMSIITIRPNCNSAATQSEAICISRTGAVAFSLILGLIVVAIIGAFVARCVIRKRRAKKAGVMDIEFGSE